MTTIQQVREAQRQAGDLSRALDERIKELWRLADATASLLDAILGTRRTMVAQESETVWGHRIELEPLANSLGYTIVESDTTKNVAIVKELP